MIKIANLSIFLTVTSFVTQIGAGFLGSNDAWINTPGIRICTSHDE